jgi:hypothetical protein
MNAFFAMSCQDERSFRAQVLTKCHDLFAAGTNSSLAGRSVFASPAVLSKQPAARFIYVD